MDEAPIPEAVLEAIYCEEVADRLDDLVDRHRQAGFIPTAPVLTLMQVVAQLRTAAALNRIAAAIEGRKGDG